jgi:hypothetical protein
MLVSSFSNTKRKNSMLFFFLVGLGFELGFMLAKQAFYHLSHTFGQFYSGNVGNGVSWTICLDWTWILILPISGSQVTGIIGKPLKHNCGSAVLGNNQWIIN